MPGGGCFRAVGEKELWGGVVAVAVAVGEKELRGGGGSVDERTVRKRPRVG